MKLSALALTALLAWPLGGRAQGPSPDLAPASDRPGAEAPGEARVDSMVQVPAGSFVPAFATVAADGSAPTAVDAFELDRTPVTVGSYLAFLRAEPAWRRSAAPAVLAGDDYLDGWRGDLDPGAAGDALERPVTGVSWFAARAYCGWRDARLPTTAEWEYAAALGGLGADGRQTPAYVRALRELYAARPAADALPRVGRTFENGPGLRDMHGLVWEWTADFNDRIATGAGRDDQGLDRQLFCAAGSVDATDRSDYAAFTRYSVRTGLTGDYAGRMLGFRCARTPSPGRTP